jgi:glycosyltransferase involved in cell wall biosynthesis
MGIEIFDAPAEIEQFQTDHPISHLMLLIWQSREDLRNAFNLNTKTGQEAFISWYDFTVIRKHDTFHSDSTQTNLLYSRLVSAEFTLSKASRWLPKPVRNKAKHFWLWLISRAGWLTAKSARNHDKPTLRTETKPSLTGLPLHEGEPGANLVGYAHAELGMGEHVRMTAAALSETDVPFGVVDFGAGTTSRKNTSLDHGTLIDSNKHKVNIFHVSPDQILPAYLHFGRGFFDRRYNIGYPFWELSKFPQEWVPSMQLLDEVWAPTTFIQVALTGAMGRAVQHMPVGVVLPKIPKLGRDYFGIPADHFLFFFAFDCYSFIDRKNPYAIVDAFKVAFPLGNEKTGLIIKAMNAKESSESWMRLVSDIGSDKRIKLINETMDKTKLLSFKSECDCYISLHRAEGLGLGPMEAMLLGKPVIVTNYSGNTDYAKPDNSCLVNYSLIPVQEGQYLFHENQVWADPDVEHAAWHMIRLANDPELCISLGKRAAAFVSTNFSPSHCGQLYKHRLQELGML